jgi:hypothetical protein
MEILEAYDLTGSYRSAAVLVGCDHHTVRRYVQLRASGNPSPEQVVRPRMVDEHLEKIDLAERISRTDADLVRLAADIDQRRTHLRRLADEVAGFLTEQQALARARATIREIDQRQGLPAPQADAAEDLADHTAAVLAAYRELTQSPGPAIR